MNIKRFIIVVLCLYVSITAFAQMDSMFRYKMAFKEMQNMLLGKQQLSIKRAVYCSFATSLLYYVQR